MIGWKKYDKDLNINDIKKVIDILPCGWSDGYSDLDENDDIIPAPKVDGNYIIYAISDNSDGYVVIYYKCSPDGAIREIGYDIEEDW